MTYTFHLEDKPQMAIIETAYVLCESGFTGGLLCKVNEHKQRFVGQSPFERCGLQELQLTHSL